MVHRESENHEDNTSCSYPFHLGPVLIFSPNPLRAFLLFLLIAKWEPNALKGASF